MFNFLKSIIILNKVFFRIKVFNIFNSVKLSYIFKFQKNISFRWTWTKLIRQTIIIY